MELPEEIQLLMEHLVAKVGLAISEPLRDLVHQYFFSQPSRRLRYLGACRVPYAGGEIVGASDDGSIFVSGPITTQQVYRIAPSAIAWRSGGIGQLPVADKTELFDPTLGMRAQLNGLSALGGAGLYRIRGIAEIGRQLWVSLWTFYNSANLDRPWLLKVGDTMPRRTTAQSAGPEDENHSSKMNGWLAIYRDSLLSGASGYEGGGRQGYSNGPAFYMTNTSGETSPLRYRTLKHPDSDFDPTDRWWGGGVLGDYFVAIGRKGITTEARPYPPDFDLQGNRGYHIDADTKRLVYYGPPYPGHIDESGRVYPAHVSSYKGYHANQYMAQVRFYRSQDLTEAHEVWTPPQLYGHPLAEISGCTSADGRFLYLSEMRVDGHRPVLHCYGWDG